MATRLKTKLAFSLALTALVRMLSELLFFSDNGHVDNNKYPSTFVKRNMKEEWNSSFKDGHYCSFRSDWHTRFTLKTSDYHNYYWTQSNCPYVNVADSGKNQQNKRIQILSLSCSEGISRLVPTWSNTSRGISSVKFGDPCLGEYIRTCCSDGKPVPNVVHYVWYKDKELDFVDFVSFISVIKFARPCLILIHGRYVPRGKYWDYVIERSPNIIHVNRSKPVTIFGQQINFHENSGDIMRIEALLKYGGIYLDTDAILVRPIDSLRKYDCTMSKQHEGLTLGSAIILAKANSTFIQYWYNEYRDNFHNTHYWYNAMGVPYKLSLNYSHHIHVENYTLARPKGYFKFVAFRENYNWTNLYGLHVYKRLYKMEYTDKHNFPPPPLTETIIRSLDSLVGSMIRYVLYGIKEVCTL